MCCVNYVGETCVNGSCPNALANEYPEYGHEQCTCEEFGYYKGCNDCALYGTEMCTHEKRGERIKVSDLNIIVTMIDKIPYYEIKYKEIGKSYYNIGYSSYELANVLGWKDDYFELVENED